MNYKVNPFFFKILLVLWSLITVSIHAGFSIPLAGLARQKGVSPVFAWVPFLRLYSMIRILEMRWAWLIPALLLYPLFITYWWVSFLKMYKLPAGWISALFLCFPLLLIPVWQAYQGSDPQPEE
jgi:hypothetical protein